MSPEEQAVSLAADTADEHTAGAWHRHFLDSLREQGWALTRVSETPEGPPAFCIVEKDGYYWTGDGWDEPYYAKWYPDTTAPLPEGGTWWKFEPVSDASDTPVTQTYRGYQLRVESEQRTTTVVIWHNGLEVDRLTVLGDHPDAALAGAKRIVDDWLNAL